MANYRNTLVAILISIAGHFFILKYFNINVVNKSSINHSQITAYLTPKQIQNSSTSDKEIFIERNNTIEESIQNLGEISPSLENEINKKSEKNDNEYTNEVKYFSRKEVSVPAEILSHIILEFPEGFYSKDNEFIVVVNVFVNEFGEVDYIEFEDNGLPMALKKVTANELSIAKFKAAEIDDSLVKTMVRLEFIFNS